MNPEYCIPHKRELNETEVGLIKFLLADSGFNEFLPCLNTLKVVARCGCGSCPTVLFGNSLTSAPVTSAPELVKYVGTSNQGAKVGVALMAKNGQLTELEAWSVCGGEFEKWPGINTLTSINT